MIFRNFEKEFLKKIEGKEYYNILPSYNVWKEKCNNLYKNLESYVNDMLIGF